MAGDKNQIEPIEAAEKTGKAVKPAKSVKSAKKKEGKHFFKNTLAEARKVNWPDRKTTFKQSIAVVVISVIVGLIIALVDFVGKAGVDFLVQL